MEKTESVSVILFLKLYTFNVTNEQTVNIAAFKAAVTNIFIFTINQITVSGLSKKPEKLSKVCRVTLQAHQYE